MVYPYTYVHTHVRFQFREVDLQAAFSVHHHWCCNVFEARMACRTCWQNQPLTSCLYIPHKTLLWQQARSAATGAAAQPPESSKCTLVIDSYT